ncbi:MAG: hypothetical protein FKY71_10420 [Spiribacter salinus]|uniref:Uncharacterized protein n=1 Tax=Spiribacter salinus TaxID=1335746 RepID=A0A540VQQ7_9GAMM|nr:MAG: hypothetical protein FKY71_10420 [Spiribacter salinus]
MSRKSTENTSRRPDLIAYHVPERDNAPWARIGAAWDHKDGEGFTVELDLVPAKTGRIVLRAPKAEAAEEEGR